MKYATPAQIKKISTLISNQHLQEMKSGLVLQFSNGRTESRKEMYIQEAAELIRFLSKEDPAAKMRNKVFAICHELGWLYQGLHDVNLAIINRFISKRGVVRRDLQRMNADELRLTVTQFERIVKKDVESDLNKVLDELGIDRLTGQSTIKKNKGI